MNKEKFIESLTEINELDDLNRLKNRITALNDVITNCRDDREVILNIDANGDTISLRRDILISELNQILESQKLEIARYYLKRLENSAQQIKKLN